MSEILNWVIHLKIDLPLQVNRDRNKPEWN